MFMAPMRSMVRSMSKPWNMWLRKWSFFRRSKKISCFLFSFRYSPAATRKPEVPQAGSQTISSGPGSMSSTIMRMMWRGVRNWPLMPEVAILERTYS